MRCSLKFIMFDRTRKIRPQSFHHWKVCLFFQNFLSSTASRILKNCSYNFQSNCQKVLWTLINCSVMFVTLDDARKNGTETFVTVKTAIIWNVCFNRNLRSHRNDLMFCTIIVKKPCGPLIIVPWHFLYSINWEKIGQNLFFIGKVAFLSKLCVFNNMFGLKRML